MDKKYVYFGEKHINWDSVRNTIHLYNPDNKTELLSGFSNMMNVIQDRHVWINTGDTLVIYNYARYYYNYISINVDIYDANNLIDTDVYKIAQLKNNIVYVEVKTFFKSSLGIEDLIKKYNYSNGIIIDVRNNVGGYYQCVLELSSNFIKDNHIVSYVKYKKSHRHDDFTDYNPISLLGKNQFDGIKLIIITDKFTYSATNFFVSIMKKFTNSIIVGNITGGGGALSFTSILPNGWTYSIAENPYFDSNYKSLEQGIEPDHLVIFGEEQYEEYGETRLHSQMEFAFNLLNK
jgi:C-terminal processing protease CtpA/Prc